MPSTADGVFRRGGGLWGEGKWVSKKMNGVGGESGLRTDPQRKEQKWEVMGCRKNGKEEDEGRRGEADCRQIRRERSNNGGSLGAGRREGSRWMMSGGGADCGRIHRERSKDEGCCNAVSARGQ